MHTSCESYWHCFVSENSNDQGFKKIFNIIVHEGIPQAMLCVKIQKYWNTSYIQYKTAITPKNFNWRPIIFQKSFNTVIINHFITVRIAYDDFHRIWQKLNFSLYHAANYRWCPVYSFSKRSMIQNTVMQ